MIVFLLRCDTIRKTLSAMIKKYKLLHIDVDEVKIKKSEPVDLDVVSQNGHKSSISLVIRKFWKKDDSIHFTFEYPADNPLQNECYIYGFFNHKQDKGEVTFYPQ